MTASSAVCPRCGLAVTKVQNAEPWCPGCEWNLDRYDPHRRAGDFGIRWLDRLTYRLAYRMTRRQYQALVGRTVARGYGRATRLALLAAAVVLLAGVAGLMVGGLYLILVDFPSITIVPGVLLVLIGVALRPKLGRLDRLPPRLARPAAPTLFALVDEVAESIGAPKPHIIAVDRRFNACASVVGLRRRRVLCLGLPLWGVLPPQQRVALIAHELGHFVNGDGRRAPLTGLAMSIFGDVAGLLRPPFRVMRAGSLRGSMGEAIGAAIAVVVFGSLRLLAQCLHVLMLCLGLRDAQRSEYLADELAARAAGSEAVLGLCDTMILGDRLRALVQREARQGNGAPRWREAADEARVEAAPRLPLLRQLSVRNQTSLFAGHPPDGLRSRLVQSRPAQPATVLLTEHRAAQVDAELAKPYEAARRDLALI